jgi:translation elongation factor P/translation initiation factor 5A
VRVAIGRVVCVRVLTGITMSVIAPSGSEIERPDTEDKGCERTQARGEEGDGRDEE